MSTVLQLAPRKLTPAMVHALLERNGIAARASGSFETVYALQCQVMGLNESAAVLEQARSCKGVLDLGEARLSRRDMVAVLFALCCDWGFSAIRMNSVKLGDLVADASAAASLAGGLQELHMCGCGIGDADGAELVAQLLRRRDQSQLRELHLSGNSLGPQTAAALSRLVSQPVSTQSIAVSALA